MKIDPLVYTARFPEQCRLDLCASRCCRFGVWVDSEEKKAILANAALFVPHLRPEAADPETWFGKTESDPDCPSGWAVETQQVDGYCAFFNPRCGCALQKAAADAGLHEWALKPRFCIMFPLVVSEGTLTVDEDMKSLWCMKEKNRTQPILSAVRREGDHLFGEETAKRLLRPDAPVSAKTAAGRTPPAPRTESTR